MVSAETRPSLRLDHSEAVPTVLQAIRNLKDIPIGRYCFETTELFKVCFDELALRSGNADTRFYLAEVTFEAISDPVEYEHFTDIPISLVLPAEDIDVLREIGRRLLRKSSDYGRLLHDLNLRAGSSGPAVIESSTDKMEQ